MTTSVDKAIAKAQGMIPECLAIGLVDVDSGFLLGVRTVDSHPREVLDLVAAATADLFQGPNVLAIEGLFKKARGAASSKEHYFQEMIVNSTNLIHVFARIKKSPNVIAVYVCKNSANIGMVLAKSRMASEGLGESLK